MWPHRGAGPKGWNRTSRGSCFEVASPRHVAPVGHELVELEGDALGLLPRRADPRVVPVEHVDVDPVGQLLRLGAELFDQAVELDLQCEYPAGYLLANELVEAAREGFEEVGGDLLVCECDAVGVGPCLDECGQFLRGVGDVVVGGPLRGPAAAAGLPVVFRDGVQQRVHQLRITNEFGLVEHDQQPVDQVQTLLGGEHRGTPRDADQDRVITTVQGSPANPGQALNARSGMLVITRKC